MTKYAPRRFIFVEPCDRWECNNGGHCIKNAALSPHYAECECTDDFEGEHCEIGMSIQVLCLLIYCIPHIKTCTIFYIRVTFQK